MVDVKKQIATPGTVVKIGVDDTGTIRVTTGSTPWVDLDEEEDEEDEENCEVLADYSPTEINYNGKKYVLREPLRCSVLKVDNLYAIEYDPLGVWGAGKTWDEALDFFSCRFATFYELFNEDGEDKLADHYVKILKAMNELVTDVKTW
jgi:hypothetical protein